MTAEETLRKRFEPVTIQAEEILRAAKQLGIPEDRANLIALGILSVQAARAEAAFRLPPNEKARNTYTAFMERLENEDA